MQDSGANPFIVMLFFVARCLIPLFIMLGITYLLRRWGLIQDPPMPPKNWNGNQNGENNTVDHNQGDVLHGNA
jgi:hypothetical protein